MKTSLFLLSGVLCDETVWQAQTTYFSSHYDVHAIGFRGFDNLVQMAQSVVNRMPAGSIVVGHSMGARVALEVYRLAPEKVRALALWDTGVHGVNSTEIQKRQAMLDLVEKEGMTCLVKQWLLPMLATAHRSQPHLVEPLTRMVLGMTPAEHSGFIRALLYRPEVESLLPTITIPVLLGVGAEDQWSPPTQHEAMLVQLSNAMLHIIQGSGHMAPFENGEAVNQVLAQWLTAV